MTMLREPPPRVQCDRCHTVHLLTSNKSQHWGQELYDAGWRAGLIRGHYQHACNLCAADFLAEFEGRKARAA